MESFIIQDLKFFTPIQLGEERTYAHFDTGAVGNMISKTRAEGLIEIERRTLEGGMGRQEVRQVRLEALNVLSRSFDHETAVVFDAESYFGETPFDVAMTLGASVLLAAPLILDFKRLWMGFAENPISERLPHIAMDCSTGLPFITLSSQQRELHTIFDTGAAFSILNANHVKALGVEVEEIYELEVQDPAGGKGRIPIFRLESLHIGNVDLGTCEAFAVSLDPIEQRLNRRIDLVLGANTMLASALVWVLDKTQNALFFSDRDVNVYA
jgi:hypothetical protein